MADDGDDGYGSLSPLPSNSPLIERNRPWGKLMPCNENDSRPIDLLPRPPEEKASLSTPSCSSIQGGVSLMGLFNLLPCDIFNQYVFGRSAKVDITATHNQVHWTCATTMPVHPDRKCVVCTNGPMP